MYVLRAHLKSDSCFGRREWFFEFIESFDSRRSLVALFTFFGGGRCFMQRARIFFFSFFVCCVDGFYGIGRRNVFHKYNRKNFTRRFSVL